MSKDTFLEPINDYTFGRGVQKSTTTGKWRWWYCEEENRISPDFELAKMGVVKELTQEDALQRLYTLSEKDETAWMEVYNNYPQVREAMDNFVLLMGPLL